MSTPTNPAKTSCPAAVACVSAEPVVDFAEWLDRQLADLESRFAGFITRDSLKQSLKGGRQSRQSAVAEDSDSSTGNPSTGETS